MKTITCLAASLLVVTGLMHVLSVVASPLDPTSTLKLAFGIIYLAVAVLLGMNFKFAPLLGIVFPLLGLGVGLLVPELQKGNLLLLGTMGLIDALVPVCCVSSLLGRRASVRAARLKAKKHANKRLGEPL